MPMKQNMTDYINTIGLLYYYYSILLGLYISTFTYKHIKPMVDYVYDAYYLGRISTN